MKKNISIIILIILIVSCKKQASLETIGKDITEKLSGPQLRGSYWELKLFSPTWMGRRGGVTNFVIGNKAYFFGGYDLTNPAFKKDLFVYNPSANSYSQLLSMPYPGLSRMFAVSFVINNKAYIVGGWGNNFLTDVWEYDPAVGMGGTWTEKADFPGPGRARAVGFSINDKGYVATGSGFAGDMKDLWEYDAAADAWIQKTDMPTINGRSEAFVFVLNNKAYIGGGRTPGQLPSFWQYDPAAGANGVWTKKTTYPGSGVYNIAAFAVNNLGYAGTGGKKEGEEEAFFKDFWQYAPSSNSWTRKADFPGYQRADAVGITINGVGYMGLGYHEIYLSTNDLYKYHP